MTVELLLFLEHKHKMMAETGLHHNPIDSARQIDVCSQKYNILALQRCYAFMGHHQVRHN